MHITPIKTHAIVANKESIYDLIDTYIPSFPEKSVLAITSKVISLCEGAVVPEQGTDKDKLVEEHADYYLPKDFNVYGFHFTITNHTMIASAGIDLSNGNGNYVLWPKDPQKSANDIRVYLTKKFNIKHAGVLIIDSKTTPLRWGTMGTSIAHSGFNAVKDYIGTKDLFDYQIRVTKANHAEGLAAASCLVMGEGAESTPFTIIGDIPFIEFQNRNPSQGELDIIAIPLAEDLYAPILKSVSWIKGKKRDS
ncbi:coenzyme F420-0:L-glutamate ligase [Candidatus Microgenomates bacterium]|nr:coenzyme F420-0:L-glutamate ligase [Candidatus Microgenomates bacterium]